MAGLNDLAELAGISETTSQLSKMLSSGQTNLVGSSIRCKDVTDHEKWIELKAAVRDFCQSLGKAHCLQKKKSSNHDCRKVLFCPLLGEMNVACLVGAALDNESGYKTCMTLAPSKHCTSAQRRITKQILKDHSAELVRYIDTASKSIFRDSIQMNTVICQG